MDKNDKLNFLTEAFNLFEGKHDVWGELAKASADAEGDTGLNLPTDYGVPTNGNSGTPKQRKPRVKPEANQFRYKDMTLEPISVQFLTDNSDIKSAIFSNMNYVWVSDSSNRFFYCRSDLNQIGPVYTDSNGYAAIMTIPIDLYSLGYSYNDDVNISWGGSTLSQYGRCLCIDKNKFIMFYRISVRNTSAMKDIHQLLKRYFKKMWRNPPESRTELFTIEPKN